MRKDEFHVGAPRCGIAHDQAHEGARRVCGIFQRLSANSGYRIFATGCFQRVRVNDSIAPVEFVEDGIKLFVAQPGVVVTSQERYAIDFQRVVGILDLAQSAVDIRHR